MLPEGMLSHELLLIIFRSIAVLAQRLGRSEKPGNASLTPQALSNELHLLWCLASSMHVPESPPENMA